MYSDDSIVYTCISNAPELKLDLNTIHNYLQ